MNWYETQKNDSWVDLNEIRFIFMQKDANNKFFLMGEFKDGSDSLVLSDSFDTKEQCGDYARKMLTQIKLYNL